MEEKAKLTNYKILIISFIAWTLTNMDQAFFGYAIPGILEEFDLPLEVAGLILTTSFVIASVMLLFTGAAADRFGRGPMKALSHRDVKRSMGALTDACLYFTRN